MPQGTVTATGRVSKYLDSMSRQMAHSKGPTELCKIKEFSDIKYSTMKQIVSRYKKRNPIEKGIHTDQTLSPPVSKGQPSQKAKKGPPEDSRPLHPFIRDVMHIQSAFKGAELLCSVKDAIALKERTDNMQDSNQIPAYKRPACFHPKQHELMDRCLDTETHFIFSVGVQRAGKSTAVMCALHEKVINNVFKGGGPLQFDLMAGKGDQARRILRDVMRDPILFALNQRMIVTQTNDYIAWFDGSKLSAHETTISDVKGSDSDFAWIDEGDVAVKKDADAVATLFMALRVLDNIKVCITANMDRGQFQLMMHTWEKLGQKFDSIWMQQILSEDAPHVKDADEKNPELREIIKALPIDAGFVGRRFDNIEDFTGSSFNPMSVEAAYSSYDTFINVTQPRPFRKVMFVDPSGTGHPMGWFVGACNAHGTEFWELESGKLQLGEDLKQFKTGRLTPKQALLFLLMKAKEHNIQLFACESNMNGKQLKAEFILSGFRAKNQNFAGKTSKKGITRGAMIAIARDIMDERAMYLCGEGLQDELIIYNPDEHDSAQYKGDEADAMIHCFYLLAKQTKSPYLHQKQTQIHHL